MSRKTTFKRLTFIGMVLLILLSAVLAFTVMRKEKLVKLPKMPVLGLPSVSGASKTLSIYQDLERLEILGQEIRETLNKGTLSDLDSMVLKSKLKQVDSIYKRASAH